MAQRPKVPPLPPGAVRTQAGRVIVNRPTISYRFNGLNGKGYTPKPEDANLLARIIYAESLSNPEDFAAIGWTTINRIGERQFGTTLDGVLRKRNQYQILEVGGGPKGDSRQWNETAEPGKLKGAKRAGWLRASEAANGILSGRIADPTGGATFFMSSNQYVRGMPATAIRGFFRSNLSSGRLVDSNFVSSSKRKTQNHFFVEVLPPVAPKSRTK